MNSRKFLASFLVLVMVLTLFSSIVWAAPGKPRQSYTLWDLIKAGGIIGWFIIMLQIASIALAIEHIVSIRRDKLIPQDLLQEIEVLFEEEEYDEAMELCEAEPTFLTNVIGAALPKIGLGYKSMVETMESVGEEESIKLHQKISWLQLISSIAPMLGLLGTVWGMMVAFGRIASLDRSPKPKELADGIFQALITTCMGLIVAILALSFFFYFRNKVVRITMEIGAVAEELIDRFRSAD